MVGHRSTEKVMQLHKKYGDRELSWILSELHRGVDSGENKTFTHAAKQIFFSIFHEVMEFYI